MEKKKYKNIKEALDKLQTTRNALCNAAERKGDEKFFCEITFYIKDGREYIKLFDLIQHKDLRELGIYVNELDENDIIDSDLILPQYGNLNESWQMIWDKDDKEIMEFLSEKFSQSELLKKTGQKINISLFILQRLTKVAVQVLFFGYFHEQIKEEDIEINIFEE